MIRMPATGRPMVHPDRPLAHRRPLGVAAGVRALASLPVDLGVDLRQPAPVEQPETVLPKAPCGRVGASGTQLAPAQAWRHFERGPEWPSIPSGVMRPVGLGRESGHSCPHGDSRQLPEAGGVAHRQVVEAPRLNRGGCRNRREVPDEGSCESRWPPDRRFDYVLVGPLFRLGGGADAGRTRPRDGRRRQSGNWLHATCRSSHGWAVTPSRARSCRRPPPTRLASECTPADATR
jgi:hypothetical protein